MARLRLSEEEKTQKRSAILEGAAALFGENGFDEVSVGDIAAASGVSTGAVYLYFSGKLDIFEQLFARALDELERAFDEALALPVPDVRTRLWLLAYSYINFYRQNNRLYRVLSQGLALGCLSSGEMLAGRGGEIIKKLEAPLIEGVLHGAIRPCDTHKTVITLMGMLDGVLSVPGKLGESPASSEPQEYYSICMELIFNGIMA